MTEKGQIMNEMKSLTRRTFLRDAAAGKRYGSVAR